MWEDEALYLNILNMRPLKPTFLVVLACFMPPCGLLGLVEALLTLVEANLKSANILNDVSSVPHGGWTMTRISWPSGIAARTASQAQHGATWRSSNIFGKVPLERISTYRSMSGL